MLIPLLAVPLLRLARDGSGAAGRHLVTIAVPLVTIIAWLIGHSIRQAQAQAELLRAQAAAQTALAERLRIARELHDIVAHSIGIIAIQAGAGRRVFDARPDEARDALAAIEAASRETLSGLRRMVTGLRRAEQEPGRGRRRWARRPAWPTSSGWPPRPWTRACRSTWTGAAAGSRSRPTSTCRRSASSRRPSPTWSATPAPASARSCIDQQDGQLSIEVTDSGRGGSPAGTGYGITGMRERAALLGGDFSAGPRPGGGFRVAARLPLPAPAR